MNPTRRLVVLTALRWFPTGLVVPVLVLLLTARGLTLAQVGQVMAAYSVVTLLLELPTGGLADSWGRRPVIVGSSLLQAASVAAFALAGTFAMIVAAAMTMGAARALSSGPVEAWFVDAVHGLGHTEIEPGLARGQIAEALALGAGAVIGGALPGVLPLPSSGSGVIAFSVPFLIAAAMGVVHAVAAGLLLTGDQRSRGSVTRTVGRAAGIALRMPAVRRLMIVAVCLGIVLSGVELVSPDRVAQLVGSATTASAVFGVLTASAFIVSAFGAGISTRLPGRRALVAALAYLGIGVLVMGLALPWIGAAALIYLLVYVGIGVQGPVAASLLHARIDSTVRSTMMSVESLSLQAGGAVASLVVGWLVTHVSLLSGLAVLAAAAGLAGVTLLRDMRHSS